MNSQPDRVWNCRSHRFNLAQRPLLMGIVNVTPDSFSDGGQFFDPTVAVDHALKLVADGADILDVGGESTRPNATPVDVDEELRRVLPVVKKLAQQTSLPVSIDTMKAEVARACLDAGASIVNDVAGFRSLEMVRAARDHAAGVVVMHMRGTPQTMQDHPVYSDIVGELDSYFAERIATLTDAGMDPEAICLDPGIGFGKTLEHTLAQLRGLGSHLKHGRPICLGVSRKGFLGQLTGRDRPARMPGTLAVSCFALAQGTAHVLRVHDVAPHRDAVKIWQALAGKA